MDPISDMFIRVKNAYKAGHETVQVPHSQFKYEIAKVLGRAGFLGKIEKRGKKTRKFLDAVLLYDEGEPKVRGVKLISKPSRRLYISYKDLRRSRHGGVIIISTPRGILTDKEAKKDKVGGELIAEIW